MIVDFACFSSRLVIEVDGGQHNMEKGQMADAKRDAYLKRNAFKVLRFWNNDVLQNMDGVMHVIRECLDYGTPTPNPSPQGGGA
jgi:very-short-patch-repair endonuclease